jgi:glycine cleavage system H lipoate-binding protein/ABC-type phosphate transport system substrate-binding protein
LYFSTAVYIFINYILSAHLLIVTKFSQIMCCVFQQFVFKTISQANLYTVDFMFVRMCFLALAYKLNVQGRKLNVMKITKYNSKNHKVMKTQSNFSKLMMALLIIAFTIPLQANQQKDSDIVKNLAISWTDAFSQHQPQSTLKLQTPESTDFGADENTLLITDETHLAKLDHQTWRMPIARDVVVGVFNINHPETNSWNETGFTAEALADYMKSNPVLISEDAQLFEMLEKFTGTTADSWKLEKMTSDEAVLQALSKAINKIGFVTYNAIKKEAMVENSYQLALLPIDRNANGKLDQMENFYTESSRFERAVWMGKYPHALTNTYFLVAANKPSDAQISFVSWALNEGQQTLAANNIGQLASPERYAQIEKLNNTPVAPPATIIKQHTWQKLILPTLGLLLIIGLLTGSLVFSQRNRNKNLIDSLEADQNIAPKQTPAGLLFDRTHTWTLMQKDGWVKTGVDEFILNATGPLSRVKLKKTGEKVEKGDALISLIQNGKSITIFSPVSGLVKAVNETINTRIQELNQSPYEKGWLYQIEPSNWQQENKLLMMVNEYSKWIGFEMNRMRDFFASISAGNTPQGHQTVLQDGGEPQPEALKNCCPEVWENFQTSFINPSR